MLAGEQRLSQSAFIQFGQLGGGGVLQRRQVLKYAAKNAGLASTWFLYGARRVSTSASILIIGSRL
jgi:hypothetical protein